MESTRVVYVSGHGKLSGISKARASCEYVSIGILADRVTGAIVDAEVPLLGSVANRVIKSCVVGFSLKQDTELMAGNLQDRFMGESTKAIIVALRMASERFNARFKEAGDNEDCFVK